MIDIGELERIVIIKPSALGDIVQSLPFLAAMRERFGSAHIAWVVNRQFRGVLDGHPLVDEVLDFDRKVVEAETEPGAFKKFRSVVGGTKRMTRLFKTLAERGFELAIDLQGLFRSGLIANRTKAGFRVGFANAREGAPFFYTHKVDVPDVEVHAVDRYLSIAAEFGCDVDDVRFPLHVPVSAVDEAQSVLSKLPEGDGPVVGMQPGGRWESKLWPAEYYAALAKRLHKDLGARIVVSGSSEEAELAESIADVAPEAAVSIAGRLSIPGLIAALAKLDLFVTNDSGPMHISAAHGVPTVAIFGPTRPARTGPYGQLENVVRKDFECTGCLKRSCPKKGDDFMMCMKLVTADEVFDKALSLFAGDSD